MRLVAGMILVGAFVLASSSPSQACGRHRGHGRCHHQQSVAAVIMQPATPANMPATYASPQMAQTFAPPQVAPVVAAAAPSSPIAEVVPSYEYTAANGDQPAYYYTYDNSGKLIVAQWMDWVFRGGLAAGAPAPPLPIIGALRNR